MTNSFKDIVAWQLAHGLVITVYKITNSFPDFERFGLSSQFQRAAVSIPANIAEGYKRIGKADKLRFLNIAQGSLEESRYYAILSKDLGYIDEEVYTMINETIERTSWFLNSYVKGIIENNALKQQL